MKGTKIRWSHENFNRKEVSLGILDKKTNIGHQKTGSWEKGHSLGYSIKKKFLKKKKETRGS